MAGSLRGAGPKADAVAKTGFGLAAGAASSGRGPARLHGSARHVVGGRGDEAGKAVAIGLERARGRHRRRRQRREPDIVVAARVIGVGRSAERSAHETRGALQLRRDLRRARGDERGKALGLLRPGTRGGRRCGRARLGDGDLRLRLVADIEVGGDLRFQLLVARARDAHVVLGDGTAARRPVLGAAVREQQRQLVARQPRPGAHGPRVDVHEGDARGRVVADAAALADQRGVAQLLHGNVGEGDVDRLAGDVQAVLGLTADLLAQHAVGLVGAVAADDVDRLLAAELRVHLPEQVDRHGVDVDLDVLAPVAHQPVDLLQGVAIVLAVTLVGDGQRLLGVDVIERDRARRAERGDDLGRACAHAQQRGGQAREETSFTQIPSEHPVS